MKMVCPEHSTELLSGWTNFGNLWTCPVAGCTVACWEGSTSTPADQETRTARHLCHQAFDPLWKGKKVFPNRRKAYLWLMDAMEVRPEKAHIGMFSLAQCERLLGYLQELEASQGDPPRTEKASIPAPTENTENETDPKLE